MEIFGDPRIFKFKQEGSVLCELKVVNETTTTVNSCDGWGLEVGSRIAWTINKDHKNRESTMTAKIGGDNVCIEIRTGKCN